MGLKSFFGKFLNKLRKLDVKAPAQGSLSPEPLEDADSGQSYKPGEVQEYLYFNRWLAVTSSNVARIRYVNSEQALQVEFHNHGSTYEYPGIGIDLAYAFAVAASKGKWVWEHLRNAGAAYRFLFSADGYSPARFLRQEFRKRVVRQGLAATGGGVREKHVKREQLFSVFVRERQKAGKAPKTLTYRKRGDETAFRPTVFSQKAERRVRKRLFSGKRETATGHHLLRGS